MHTVEPVWWVQSLSVPATGIPCDVGSQVVLVSFMPTFYLVVLGSIRKQAEQALGSEPVSSTPPWPLQQVLLPGSCPV